jgi:hypothetical protein
MGMKLKRKNFVGEQNRLLCVDLYETKNVTQNEEKWRLLLKCISQIKLQDQKLLMSLHLQYGL